MKERLTKYSNETSHKNGVCCTHFLSDECRALGGEKAAKAALEAMKDETR